MPAVRPIQCGYPNVKKGGSAGFGRAYSSRGGSRQSSLDAQMKVYEQSWNKCRFWKAPRRLFLCYSLGCPPSQ